VRGLVERLSGGDALGYHLFEHDFKGLGVATPAMDDEVFAIALPIAIIETHGVFVVAAVELKRELVEAETFAFTGVALGFFDFADCTAVH